MTLHRSPDTQPHHQANPYPIPQIEDMIDDIGQVSYITALNHTKGYWQESVAMASQEKTAFVTPRGKYQFVTMHFGLDQLFNGTQMFAAAHQDDVIIHVHSRCGKNIWNN